MRNFPRKTAKKNTRRSTAEPRKPIAQPIDVHFRILLEHVDSEGFTDTEHPDHRAFDDLARRTLEPGGLIDWHERLYDRIKKAPQPTGGWGDQAAVLNEIRRAFNESTTANPQQITVNGPAAFDLIVALTDDAFRLGIAVAYRLLKGGTR